MISFEKIVIVLVSVLLSIISNRLLGMLDYLKDTKIRKSRAKQILPLFAADLQNAIVHKKYAVAEDSYKLLLSYYDALSKDKTLLGIFDELVGFYHFLKNDGYVSVESRSESDIKQIDLIIAPLSSKK